ncbi:MAG: hypothetical protein COS40_07070 [Deltaproteobacteria bacterium CG03_land_8_20_14_0_80_45_14]|jgi:hypothetical protein|nr:MAG: hypothetical protein COS40_07070 [Deltaproteobacteria bacterium CG03_land_8_20_14_0_80_45_14]
MVAYEFYWRDPIKGLELIGVLPERRRNPIRITSESVMNWGKKVLGENSGLDNIFFVQVTIDNTTDDILRFKAHKYYQK